MDYTYNITEEKDCKRIIDIEIPKNKVDEKFDEVFRMLKKEAKIPGFRPGKAPMSVVKSRFGNDARSEVGETLIQDAFQEIIKEAKLSPIAPPVLSEVDFKDGEPIKFTASIEVAPDVKLDKIDGFTIKKPSEVITDADAEMAYSSILEMYASLEPSDEPAVEGNHLTVDMEKISDPDNRMKESEFKDFSVELSRETSLPSFIDALVGTKAGDEREVTVDYPADYAEKSLAGSTLKFKVRVTAVKKRVPPELNDEFFKKFGEELKSVDELKAKIKSDLEMRRKKEIQEDIREQAIKSVIFHNQFEMPQSLLESYLDDVVEDFRKQQKGQKIDEAELRQKYRAVGIRMIRWNILMYEIAESKGIKVEKDDIDKWIDTFADRYNITVDQARRMLEQSKKVQDVRETVLEAKVMSYILDNSEIVDA
ncbi:MAG: trigger factor [candidate division Zixibacteria bacterium]|nr:trigger factor [candidate division Zixibacteria bacterium]MBU1470173.1 trigger factor [candidate division Zixibacteria bacterium]